MDCKGWLKETNDAAQRCASLVLKGKFAMPSMISAAALAVPLIATLRS